MVCVDSLCCYGLYVALGSVALVYALRWFIRAPSKGTSNKKRLDGKIVVITGSNTGIGKETARDLSKRGARVIMLCRSVSKTEEAAKEIKAATGNNVEVEQMDLSSLKSVRDCAKRLNKKLNQIDYLINNAGVMYCQMDMKTAEGYDMQFGTNHLGHFLLTELLMPLLMASAASGFHPRIVLLSSVGHTFFPMNWDDINFETTGNTIHAYSQSKLANVLHGKELARRLEGTNITVYSVHPGAVHTELGRHIFDTWYGFIFTPITWVARTPLNGAETSLYCVLDDAIENESGNYYADCREKAPHRRAMIEADQKRLWQLSEKMVKM